MSKQLQPSSTAVAYANALLELANERSQNEPIRIELVGLREVLAQNPTFRAFLSDPSIGHVERGEVLKRVFADKIMPLLEHFLSLLAVKGKLGHLDQIATAYDELLEAQLGKIEVDVTVAQKLSAEQLEEVRKNVSAALKKDAVVHQYVDPSIIGGLVLRVQDKLIDGSVKTQLDRLRKKMLSR